MQTLNRMMRKLAGVGSSSIAQAIQSLSSMVVLMLAAKLLGIEALGLFSILYGALVLAAAITSGFIGDTLMVLDRHNPHIQAGLRTWFVTLALLIGVVGFGLTLAATQLGVIGAFCYALASIAYVAEDLVRRCHMAVMNFGRLVVVDLVVLVSTALTLGIGFLLNSLTLEIFLLAIFLGQLTGAIYGWVNLPASEKVRPARPAELKAVAAFGAWRSALQGLRPSQLTLMRVLVTVIVGLTAAGQMEAARIYAAPAMLLVTGTCSYLFADLARRSDLSMREQLRRTDAVVWKLFTATIICAAIGLVLLPWGGPLLTGIIPSALAVTGWLAYASAVAVSTPYGLLAAVREKARPVFLVRFLDSVLSLLLVLLVLVTTGDYFLVPWAAAVGALTGGLSIRRWVVGNIIIKEENEEHHAEAWGGDLGQTGVRLARKEADQS